MKYGTAMKLGTVVDQCVVNKNLKGLSFIFITSRDIACAPNQQKVFFHF